MAIFIFLIVIILIIGFVSYYYYKAIVNEILETLVVLDKIFEKRYDELSKSIAQFQKYMPNQKNLIFEVQRAKADAAKVSKPKTTEELAQKIINENALTININALIDSCDFQNIHPDLKECIKKQVNFIQEIEQIADNYNKSITLYKQIKNIFPFNFYSKSMEIDLDLDTIKTE